MTICIPSYQRAGDFKTFNLLGNAFSKDEIIIGTQTEEDFLSYKKLFGEKATVIYGEAHSCGENRNNLLEWCQRRGDREVLFLDDDLRHIRTIRDDRLGGAEFRELMEKCFDICRKNGIVMFGSYATDNRLMMSKTATPNIIDGMLCGLLDTSLRFDATFTTKSDYELSLRLMSKGRKVIRFNSFAPASVPRTKGGCYEIRQRKQEYYHVAELLLQAYPQYIKPHPCRKGEIKFKNK